MNEVLATEGLRSFVGKLTSVQADRFARVMNHLEAQGSEVEILRLEQRLAEVQEELDRSTTIRNSLTTRQKDLRGALGDIDKAIGQGEAPSDLVELRLLLQQLEAEVEEEIAITRPVELLASKARLRKEISRQRLMGRLAAALGEAVRGRTQSEIMTEVNRRVARKGAR